MELTTDKKQIKGRFVKGKSGNPGGRPKKTQAERDALEMIRKMAPEAVIKMKEMLDDPDTPAAVKAKICTEILDRTYGKAFQSIDVSGIDRTVTVKIGDMDQYGD